MRDTWRLYISRFTSDPLVSASVDDSYLKQLGFFLKSSPGRSDVQLGLRTTPLISHRIQLRTYYVKGCPPNRPSSNDQTLQVPFGLLAFTSSSALPRVPVLTHKPEVALAESSWRPTPATPSFSAPSLSAWCSSLPASVCAVPSAKAAPCPIFWPFFA